jgi:phenylacetate-CoA ligase
MLNYFIDAVSDRLPIAQLGRFYTSAPQYWFRRFALSHFRQTVRWAGKHSKFYREKFAEHGIDPRKIKRPEDLGDFFTTPDDLQHRPTDFLCQPAAIVFESSGTSGKNKQVYYSQDELAVCGHSMAGGMRLMGVAPEDRIANAFDFCMWIPGLLAHYGIMASGNFCMAFGKVDPVEVYRRLKQYNFNVVMGEPTWLIRLTELAERDGGGNLKLMIGGAEEMPADAIPWMRKVWNGVSVKMAYGSVEQGSALAFQPCPNHDGYHLDNVNFLPEIIEPDADGYGELVFTTLRRKTMPLIRYRSRDVTRFVAGCACGMTAPRIERLRGRRDELIVASGGNLYPLMFENILRPVAGVEHDFQIVFKLDGIREILEMNVESDRTDASTLFDEIKVQASDQYPDLMKNLALGIFQMTLKIHPPGTIRTSRKLKRMLDQRHFGPAAESEEPVELLAEPAAIGHEHAQ